MLADGLVEIEVVLFAERLDAILEELADAFAAIEPGHYENIVAERRGKRSDPLALTKLGSHAHPSGSPSPMSLCLTLLGPHGIVENVWEGKECQAMRMHVVLAVVGFSLGLSGPAAADPAYNAADIVSLFAAEAETGATRGICIGTEAECGGATAEATASPTFDLLVTFGLDSDQLTPEAQQNLDEFAKALLDPTAERGAPSPSKAIPTPAGRTSTT